MSLVLTGIVRGMRPVGGEVSQGSRQGEKWQFLSLEITDPRYGNVYSCQMRSQDKQYKDMVESKVVNQDGKQVEKYFLKQGQDLSGHKVKVTVTSITAGEREIEDKDTGEARTIIQVRTQITNIRDLGEPNDDE